MTDSPTVLQKLLETSRLNDNFPPLLPELGDPQSAALLSMVTNPVQHTLRLTGEAAQEAIEDTLIEAFERQNGLDRQAEHPFI